MKESKIVTIEDRIPKLKQQRRKKANRRLIALLFVFFTLIAGVIYIQSPLSHVKTINVSGNEMYTTQQVVIQTGITSKTNIWKVTTNDVSSKLKVLPEIKEAIVSIHWPNTLNIKIKEYQRIAYLSKDSSYYPVLENGKILESRKTSDVPVNAPVLFEFKEGIVLNKMVESLKMLPEEVMNSISEIHYTPEKTDSYHISLFMNNGFEISATLRTFTEKMSEYPSIISQLDPNKKGIIDLEVGSYFQAFPTEGDAGPAKNQSQR